jgi:sugar phosphate isomerase/epimerase
MAALLDIRIGTLVGIKNGPSHIPQIIDHGFESFQLTGGFGSNNPDFERIAGESLAALGGKAVISSIGYFGNPIHKPEDAKEFADYIDNAHRFNTDLVIGFAGAIPGQSIPDTVPAFVKTWSDLARRAQDKGVKIAFENCDMGCTWGNGGNYNVAHAPAFWDIMFNELPFDNVGLCWEPCHQLYSLVDPIPNLRKYVKKVFTVHGKDATVAWDVVKTYGIRGGQTYVWHRTPGFGDTNWTDVVSILRMNGYKGSIDIEGWHDPVYRGDLEMTGQVHALNYLKTCRGGAQFVQNPK